jgi:hypothetical protein
LHAEKSPIGSVATARKILKEKMQQRSSADDALAARKEEGKKELQKYTAKLLSRFDSFLFFDSGRDSNWSDAAFGFLFNKAIRAADDSVQVCSPMLHLTLLFWRHQPNRRQVHDFG